MTNSTNELVQAVREFIIDLYGNPELNPTGQLPDAWGYLDDGTILAALEAAGEWEGAEPDPEPTPARFAHPPAAVPGVGGL